MGAVPDVRTQPAPNSPRLAAALSTVQVARRRRLAAANATPPAASLPGSVEANKTKPKKTTRQSSAKTARNDDGIRSHPVNESEKGSQAARPSRSGRAILGPRRTATGDPAGPLFTPLRPKPDTEPRFEAASARQIVQTMRTAQQLGRRAAREWLATGIAPGLGLGFLVCQVRLRMRVMSSSGL